MRPFKCTCSYYRPLLPLLPLVSAAPNTWIMLSFPCLGLCTSPSPLLSSLSLSSLSLRLNRFCVFSETLAARQLCPFWVMTSSAAGRPGCSASVPKRVWWLARRCVSRNTLYPNADLIRPDCSPSYFIQNRERGAEGGGGQGGEEGAGETDQRLKMKLKHKAQMEFV